MARKPIRKSRGRDRDDRGRKKGCIYCRNKVDTVDYKLHALLRTFMSDKGKIRGRRVTGLCRRHQNQASTAIKRSREIALLPYVGS